LQPELMDNRLSKRKAVGYCVSCAMDFIHNRTCEVSDVAT